MNEKKLQIRLVVQEIAILALAVSVGLLVAMQMQERRK